MTEQGERARSVRCISCGERYSNGSWRALGQVKTLGLEEIGQHVVAWPAGHVVEVRACVRCGRALACLCAVASSESP
jgi:hypothetical protein